MTIRAHRSRDEILGSWFRQMDRMSLAAELIESYERATAAAEAHLGAPPYWTFISQADRDAAAASGAAMPDGSYPITTCTGDNSVTTAIKAVGRGTATHDAIRKHIMTRAKSLGCSSMIPDTWNADGSMKATASSLDGTVALADAPPAPAAATAPGTGTTAAAAPPAEPTEPADGPTAAEAADMVVVQALTTLQDAAKRALDAQTADPDTSDPIDQKVAQNLGQISSLIEETIKAQSADTDTTKPAPPDPTKEPPKPPAAATPAEKTPPATDAPPAAHTAAQPASFVAGAGTFATPRSVTEHYALLQMASAPPAAVTGQTPGNSGGVAGDGDDSPPTATDIEAATPCENPTCQHLASSHQDTTDGQNTGACQMNGCSCPGMVATGTQLSTGTSPNSGGGGPNNAGGDDTADGATAPPRDDDHSAAPAVYAADPTAAAPAPAAPSPSGSTPPLPGSSPAPSALMGPPFTIPIGIIEGVNTSDGRSIAPTALGWRTPPLPLMFMDTMPHDPSGMDMNDPAVLVGRIDEVMRCASNPAIIQAVGFFLPTKDAEEAALKLEGMGRIGVSADVGEGEMETTFPVEMPSGPIAMDDIIDIEVSSQLVKGTIMGFTMCVQPAFEDCYVVLGDHLLDVVADPTKTAEPAPSMPADTLPVAASGARRRVSMDFHLVDSEVCEPCEQSTSVGNLAVVASAADGLGPLAAPAAWFTDPGFKPGDGRLREYLDPKTLRASGRFGCPTTIEDSGEVYGHLAVWGVCHTSPMYKGQCLMAPRSRSDYSMWYRGQHKTAEGELVDVGCLTAGLGHAGLSFSASQAMAHYDDTRYAVADVVVGEDEFGIWFHGTLRPTATAQQVYVLRASTLSGDWRPQGNRQELVAALAVNSPGFPHVKAHRVKGKLTSLVAAGTVMYDPPPAAPPKPLSIEDRILLLEGNLSVLAPLAHDKLVADISAMRV